MKRTIIFFFAFVIICIKDDLASAKIASSILVNDEKERPDSIVNPLSSYDVKWNEARFSVCNTAKNIKYLNAEEKNLIWILNMIRLDPQLFLNTVVIKADFWGQNKSSSYFKSLIADLKKLKPNDLPLLPDSAAFVSARCHAVQAGKRGYVGHERTHSDCVADFYAECCEYGNRTALNILMNLLIDEGIASLGHRITCLSPGYSRLGVCIRPHITYGTNTVMDFK